MPDSAFLYLYHLYMIFRREQWENHLRGASRLVERDLKGFLFCLKTRSHTRTCFSHDFKLNFLPQTSHSCNSTPGSPPSKGSSYPSYPFTNRYFSSSGEGAWFFYGVCSNNLFWFSLLKVRVSRGTLSLAKVICFCCDWALALRKSSMDWLKYLRGSYYLGWGFSMEVRLVKLGRTKWEVRELMTLSEMGLALLGLRLLLRLRKRRGSSVSAMDRYYLNMFWQLKADHNLTII